MMGDDDDDDYDGELLKNFFLSPNESEVLLKNSSMREILPQSYSTNDPIRNFYYNIFIYRKIFLFFTGCS